MLDMFKSIPRYMDYDGQRRAEKIFQTIIVLFAVAGLIWGYAVQQFSHTVYILAGGFLLSCLITLPPWPFYRCQPLNWQKPRNGQNPRDGQSPRDESHTPKGKKKAK